MIRTIAFDADDTLWHSEILYNEAQERLVDLLTGFESSGEVLAELYQTEMSNLPLYGYGINSFGLSMIETAVRLSNGSVDGHTVQAIIEIIKGMKKEPVRLIDGVAEVIRNLAGDYRLMVITKGDLLDQQAKVERSGLADCFSHIEVVSTKTVEVYRALLTEHRIECHEFVMVGNSPRSDIVPVVALGARAVHIPYPIVWPHEQADVGLTGTSPADYYCLEHIGLLPSLVAELDKERGN
jgi:putative hydrolase of the HAD superfamily